MEKIKDYKNCYIRNLDELVSLRDQVNSGMDFRDIQVVQLCPFEKLDDWTPIGTQEHPFRGIYNGFNQVIKEIYSWKQGEAGLFGYVENAVIEDVTIEQGTVAGEQAAGICVSVKNSTVQGCRCGAFIKSIYNPEVAGGIVGINDNGTVKSCIFGGRMESTAIYGGICGKNNGTVSECTLLVNIPGIGEGTPGEITVSCEEEIVCYKDNIPPKPSCRIKVNEDDTLQTLRKKLEDKGFISPDDESGHIGYRFMMKATETSSLLPDMAVRVELEPYINYKAILHEEPDKSVQLINIYKEVE